MVSINLVDPLSIEHNTNSSLGLEVKYVAKKTQCHYPSLISVVCVGYVLLSNTKFLISGDVQHFFLSISCKYYITLVHQHTYMYRLCNTLPEVKTRVLSWWKETLLFFEECFMCLGCVNLCHVVSALIWCILSELANGNGMHLSCCQDWGGLSETTRCN